MINKDFKKKSFTPRDGIIDYYLRDIRPTKPDADRERELIEIYYSNESSEEEKLKARNEIVTMNQRFLMSIAKGYAKDDNDLLMDLISQGNIGMIEAFPNYDPATGNRFCTFAKYYICRAITNYMADENLLIRPTNNMRITPKVKVIEEEFERVNHRKPTYEEVEEILQRDYGITLSEKTELAPVVIDRIDEPNDTTEEDDKKVLARKSNFTVTTSVENLYDQETEIEGLKYDINTLMSVLTPREREVIKMAYGMDGYMKPYKNYEIGEAIHRTAECARQIKNNAIKKLRMASLNSNITF